MIGELLVLYNTLFNYFLLKFTKEITGLYVKNEGCCSVHSLADSCHQFSINLL